MKTKIALFTATTLIAGCASVSEPTRTVNVEKWAPETTALPANFSTTGSADQAAAICETDDMRRKVIDNNHNNDAVRVMVFEYGDTDSRVLSEVEIDCRDYFLRKSLSPAKPTLIQTVAPTAQRAQPEQRRIRTSPQRDTYLVKSGDTVWGIARQYCTTAKAISRLNGLGRGNVIDIDQRLELPDDAC